MYRCIYPYSYIHTHTPHTLHLTPHILHPTPYTLHPTPPTPCTLMPESKIQAALARSVKQVHLTRSPPHPTP